MKQKIRDILDLIGNTPLVPLKRLNPNKSVTILVKLESFNPGGSIKDRIALNMIESAERRGELTKDKIVLEASSGNTGIGLAMVCAVKGYRCLIAMSEGASLERRKIMKAFGAKILLTPAHLGTDGAIEAVYKLYREHPDKYFLTDQFNNPDNWKAHYNTTALEIWEQTEGKVDKIIATMGTTGTLMGLAKRFKEMAPNVVIIGVEPLYGHAIQGLKNMKESYKPGIFDKRLPDMIINCEDEEAFETARRLAREEGIFVGMSSGAAVASAIKLASQMDKGCIVAILPDGGERYLSTNLFPMDEEENGKNDNSTLKILNTKTNKKEIFKPLSEDRVGIYSCGPTVCEYIDLSMARRVLTVDLLKRLLIALGHKIVHVMNITDIDDRTVNAAIDAGLSLKEMTDKYSKAFFEDVKRLNIIPADYYPFASHHIDEMVETTKKLIEKGFAYERHGSVYFDVSKLSGYGDFSRTDLNGIDIGRTVDLDEYEKDSPLDFTLFKRVSLKELKIGIGFETPWGMARPGWHIECAAMSRKYLGDLFDIHTSGTNLIFPHHENEVAISKALGGGDLARYWLHSGLVIAEERDNKRITIRSLIEKGVTGRQIRFFILKTHYRKQILFSKKRLEDSIRALSRLDAFMEDLKSCLYLEDERDISPNIKDEVENLNRYFFEKIVDDLNTSGAFGAIFSFVRKINPLITQGKINCKEASFILKKLKVLDEVLAIFDIKSAEPKLSDDIKILLKRRQEEREKGNFSVADKIRKDLKELGYELIDTPIGTRVRILK